MAKKWKSPAEVSPLLRLVPVERHSHLVHWDEHARALKAIFGNKRAKGSPASNIVIEQRNEGP